ncbi:MAG: hypothetical protein M3O98_02845 [Actinomycetota bacterium]|nr:hypothetical protein [Actinomycetota bacterium]
MLGDAVTLQHGSEGSRRLLGRLAGVLFLGSGVITLVTLPIAPADQSRTATFVIALAALAIGVFA